MSIIVENKDIEKEKLLEKPENRTEEIKRQVQELIDQAYQRGYKKAEEDYHIQSEKYKKSSYQCGYEYGFKAGQENALVVDYDKFIEQGRNEAWKCILKIVGRDTDCLSQSQLYEIFGTIDYMKIVLRYSPTEAIEKIQEYEEKQKNDEIHVGDEVQNDNGMRGVVVGSCRNSVGAELISILHPGEDFEVPQIMPRGDYKKTGRYFPEIAEVLKKIQ